MKYPIVDRAQGQEVLNLRGAHAEFNIEAYVQSRGEGADFDDSWITELRKELLAIKSKYPAQLLARDVQGGQFEAEASPVIHRMMPRAVWRALSDPDFWRYLAIVHFPALVEWRHGSSQSAAHPNNYGIGNTRRNLLYRMWLRSEIAFDPSSRDPFHLARVGDKDVWESHIIAVRIGNARAAVRSFLSYLYPKDLKGKCRLKTKEVRELAKRLTRLRANILFELFDFDQATSVISREADRAKLELNRSNA